MNKENFERYQDIIDKILEYDRLKAIISNIESYCQEKLQSNKNDLQCRPMDGRKSFLNNEISILKNILDIIYYEDND